MYLVYLDESEDDHNFVLAGLAVVDSQVLHIAREVDELESRRFPGLPDSERPVLLHCTVI